MTTTPSALMRPGETEQPKAISGEYRPDLDGLRALAAVAVVAAHTLRFVPGGRTGVDMFFVLSGFLISGIILRALVQKQFSFGTFYSRRIRRIFPALTIVLLAVWIVGAVVLLPDDYERLGKGIATNAAFSGYLFTRTESNFWDLYVTDHGGILLAQLWSLGVEEQFYLFWPLILVAAFTLVRGRLSQLTLIVALVTSIALTLALISSRLPPALNIVPWRAVFELALGATLACTQLAKPEAVAMLQQRLTRCGLLGRWLMSANVRGVIAVTLLLASILIDARRELFPNFSLLATSLGTVALISAGMTSSINRIVFGSRPMVFLGLISYPVFLWHYPLVMFLDVTNFTSPMNQWLLFVVVLTASVGLGFMTYKFVELPVRFHPQQTRAVVTLAGVMTCCGLLGLATFLGLVRPLSFYEGADPARAAAEDWLWNSNNVRWTRQQQGIITLGRGTPRVLFFGDSNMQQYFPRIEQIYAQQHAPGHGAVFLTRFGCIPGVDELGVTKNRDRADCRRLLEESMVVASSPAIDTVVIAASWYVYFARLSKRVDFGRPAPLRSGSEAAFTALNEYIRQLTSQGKVVYLVLSIPLGRELDPRALAGLAGQRKTPEQIGAQSADAQVVHAALAPIHDRLRQIARDNGAIVIDPLASLCDTKSCPAVAANGTLMYHDLWHLRPSYVRHEVHFLDAVLSPEAAHGKSPKAIQSFHQRAVDECGKLCP